MATYRITAPDGNSYEITAPDEASQDEVLAYAQQNYQSPQQSVVEKPQSTTDRLKEASLATVGGLVKGASNIGRTILYPFDYAGLSAYSPEERKARLEDFGQQFTNPAFKASELVSEIAGTAGAGGLIGRGVSKVAPALGAAIESGGFSLGTEPAKALSMQGAKNAATRLAGGAISGGAMTGLANPEDAATGALLGAAIPAAGKLAGEAGKFMRGAPQSPEMQAAIQESRNLGYVIPPTQAKPSLGNRLMEGFAGKLTTAQNASARNAEITNALAAKSIGLPADTTITPDILNSIRKSAGTAYDVIGRTGTITPSKNYVSELDKIAQPYIQAAQGFPSAKPSPVLDLVESLKSPAFDASSAVEKIKQLRTAADDAFRSGNTDIARASKSAANILENEIETHLQKINAPDLLNNFREGRKLIAKTYTLEKALNPATGTIDANKLGSMLKSKKPLSGEMKQIAEFANRFPKAAQKLEGMGSLPQSSPLDWGASIGASVVLGDPTAMAGVFARPIARKLSLSDLVQNRLLTKPSSGNSIMSLLENPVYRDALLQSR